MNEVDVKLALRTGNTAKTDRPLGVMVLTILELFVGILGTPTGGIMLMDPTGRTLGLDSFGLMDKKTRVWTTALVLAVVELIWIAGQILPLYRAGFSVWQGIIAAIALATIYFPYYPTVKAYFNK